MCSAKCAEFSTWAPGRDRAISSFARLSNIDPGLERLRRDVESSAWRRRHEALLSRDSLDLGYRLIVAGRLAHDT
jgi:hypothetical protein